MALWTDLVTPETLTGFARRAQADIEARKGQLSRWLPNRTVADMSVRMLVGSAGLVEEASYRAFDAEPEFGSRPGVRRVTIDLPPLSQQGIIGEREQYALRGADEQTARNVLFRATEAAVQAIVERSERQRGTVLATGQATINQRNYVDSADFGRDESLTMTAGTLWNTPGAQRLEQLSTWADQYAEVNGDRPGALLMSTRVLRALTSGSEFAINLASGSSRPATRGDVEAILAGAGLPPIHLYDRRTSAGKVIPDHLLLLLPEPSEDDQSELGATFWGQTLAAGEPEYQIAQVDQPGIVAAAFTNDGIPPIRHTFADSLTLPVLANANLSMAVAVLPEAE